MLFLNTVATSCFLSIKMCLVEIDRRLESMSNVAAQAVRRVWKNHQFPSIYRSKPKKKSNFPYLNICLENWVDLPPNHMFVLNGNFLKNKFTVLPNSVYFVCFEYMMTSYDRKTCSLSCDTWIFTVRETKTRQSQSYIFFCICITKQCYHHHMCIHISI